MINNNLNSFPTCGDLYEDLSTIPCKLEKNKNSLERSITLYSDEVEPNALMTHKDGNFIISTMDDNEKDVWTTVQGDNSFGIKTQKEISNDDDTRVTITTTVCPIIYENFSIQEHVENTNATIVKHTFKTLGSNNDAKLLNNEVILSGFNKPGVIIPTFSDVNAFAGSLGKVYATSEYVKEGEGNTNGKLWDIIGSGVKAGLALGGGVIGGVIGGPAGAQIGKTIGGTIGKVVDL